MPNTAPTYGAESLDSVGAALDQSVSEHGQNDSRSEAERRLRENGDATSIVVGSTATSLGATFFVGGIALGSSLDWKSPDCPACLSSLVLATFGFQLAVLGLIGFADYGSDHAGRGHARRVRALVRAMEHPSLEAARAARRGRLAVGWSLLASGVVLVGSSVALWAMGHQDGFDDWARHGLAAANAIAGGWLTTLGSAELATKWTDEMALAPTRGGAMITYERRW